MKCNCTGSSMYRNTIVVSTSYYSVPEHIVMEHSEILYKKINKSVDHSGFLPIFAYCKRRCNNRKINRNRQLSARSHPLRLKQHARHPKLRASGDNNTTARRSAENSRFFFLILIFRSTRKNRQTRKFVKKC